MIANGQIKTSLEFVSRFMFSLDSTEEFPINIDCLIDWKVYDRKNNTKARLQKNFILDTDYKVKFFATEPTAGRNSNSKHGGTNKEEIMLTVDCFKSMCMLANSEIGKKVKNYYLDLEKVFKQYMIFEYQEQLRIKEQEHLLQLQLKDQEYNALYKNHNNLLKRRKRDVFEIGNVVYILTHHILRKTYDKHTINHILNLEKPHKIKMKIFQL